LTPLPHGSSIKRTGVTRGTHHDVLGPLSRVPVFAALRWSFTMICPRKLNSGMWRILACGLVWLGALGGASAWGYKPESPEVRKLVERGLGFLAQMHTLSPDRRLGGKCLTGLCYLKYYKMLERDEEGKKHPLVQEALANCARAKLGYGRSDSDEGMTNYSLGIALMFLCELDPVANRQLIEQYVAELMKRQQSWGSWGYGGEATGDTSQTQYAVLGMWMAQKVAKIDIPIEAQEACAAWLMRTQSSDGGWGYQGQDPGSFSRIQQENISLSLSAAGCSSLYIMADLLQVTASAEQQKERPGPFKTIEGTAPAGAPKKGPLTRKLDPGTINQYLAHGDGWFAKNYNIQSNTWQHYYMYALERYESFKDLADGKWTDEPKWYNDGVRFLQQSQRSDGGWDGQDTPSVATCFAILFLLRSSQRIIIEHVDLGSGVALGGFGLPPNVENIQERDGKVVDTDISGEVNQVMDLLKKGNDPAILRMIEDSKSIKLDGDVTKRQSQIETLRKLVSSGEPDARVLAVRAIGGARGLANVPTLLFALSDPHKPVVLEADRALRFVSRKTEGVGLPTKPTDDEIKAARADWKAWYLSVKPDAELLD
jgi:hypothetical protein